MITYLKACCDKQSATVQALFMEAVEQLGIIPERVHLDKGRENVSIMFIIYVFNNSAIVKPILAGHSIHNTCIERL